MTQNLSSAAVVSGALRVNSNLDRLNPFRTKPMEFSIKLDTGWSIVYSEGLQVIISKKKLYSRTSMAQQAWDHEN